MATKNEEILRKPDWLKKSLTRTKTILASKDDA